MRLVEVIGHLVVIPHRIDRHIGKEVLQVGVLAVLPVFGPKSAQRAGRINAGMVRINRITEHDKKVRLLLKNAIVKPERLARCLHVPAPGKTERLWGFRGGAKMRHPASLHTLSRRCSG